MHKGTMVRKLSFVMVAMALGACSTSRPPRGSGLGPEESVRMTELAFAKSMADRDFDAFVRRVSPDAVFFDGGKILRGAAEVSTAWKPFFRDAKAPFSWTPDRVVVLASGDLALTTGPVIQNGMVVGRFNSIWRLEAPHTWRIVFDKGEAVCADQTK